jgi:hypothetical protein
MAGCLSVLPRVAAVAVGAGCVRVAGCVCWLLLCKCKRESFLFAFVLGAAMFSPAEAPIISGFLIACAYVLTVVSAYAYR